MRQLLDHVIQASKRRQEEEEELLKRNELIKQQQHQQQQQQQLWDKKKSEIIKSENCDWIEGGDGGANSSCGDEDNYFSDAGTVGCCIFLPAFGCCALQTLVNLVIFSIFAAKNFKKARILQQNSAKNSFFCISPKRWSAVLLPKKLAFFYSCSVKSQPF